MVSRKPVIIWQKISFFVIVLLDQVTKFFIRTYLSIGDSIHLLPFFSITYVRNTGVSFGLFRGSNWLFIIVSLLVLGFFAAMHRKNEKYQFEMTVIMAGIAGNLVDRIFLGYVVDFLHVSYWPVFNISDMAISFGILWLVFRSWKNNDDLRIR